MTDPHEPASLAEGESLAAALGAVTWQVDLPPEIPEAEAAPEPASPPPALASPPPAAPAEPDRPPSPDRIVEALLFVGGPPLTAGRAAEVVRGLSAEQFARIVDELNLAWRRENRPYCIEQTAAGAVLALRPAFRHLRERFLGGPREARLSQPALDVLALVAYRQPATKAEIDTVRGSDSGSLLRQLVRLGLLAIAPRSDGGQKEVRYQTTPRFLELFHLGSLDDLPRTGDLQRL